MTGNKFNKKAISLILSGVLAVSMVAPGLAYAVQGDKKRLPEIREESQEQIEQFDENPEYGGNLGKFEALQSTLEEYNGVCQKINKIADTNLDREIENLDAIIANNVRTHNKLVGNTKTYQKNYQELLAQYQARKAEVSAFYKESKYYKNELQYGGLKKAEKALRIHINADQEIRRLTSKMTFIRREFDKTKTRLEAVRNNHASLEGQRQALFDKLAVRRYELQALEDAKKLLLEEIAKNNRERDIYLLKKQIKKVNPNLKDKDVEEIIKFQIAKEPKSMLRKIKDSLMDQLNPKTIATWLFSSIITQYAKGFVINSVKDLTGVNIVGKTYSYAEMASLVNSIDASVDVIQENIKTAKEEFSNMMAETAYRDFIQCATNLKEAYAGIQNALEGAAVWGRFKAGDDCTDEAVINKYANEAFIEYLNGRYDYVDSLIMNYIEFKNRLTTSFANNGKTVIDLVDEATDKQNDIFKETAMKKNNFRESVKNTTLSVAVLMDYMIKVNDDLFKKYKDASAQIAQSMDDTNKFIDAKSIIKKYGLEVTKGADGKETCDALTNPYLVSKKAYVKSADYLTRNTYWWMGITGEVKGSSRVWDENPYYNTVIAPFPKMINSIEDRLGYRGNPEEYIFAKVAGMYIEDFKNSEAPCYRKWNDAYLGKDDISRLLSNKPANVSFKDYLTQNLGFDLGKDVANVRYVVVDCQMDYIYHRGQRDDFEMRLSYFDMQTGKFLQNQVVARGCLKSDSDTSCNIGKYWRSSWLNVFSISGTEVMFYGILSEKEDIIAIPFEK